MWRDVIEVGNEVETIEYGEVIRTKEYRKVYADKQSVRQSEFYQSASVGLKPELVFVVKSVEFNNDEYVRYEDKEYTIIRTYDKGETTELTVSSHRGSEV
jgi:SPP1 family predicted phage head-tail adaptor